MNAVTPQRLCPPNILSSRLFGRTSRLTGQQACLRKVPEVLRSSPQLIFPFHDKDWDEDVPGGPDQELQAGSHGHELSRFRHAT